MGRVKVLPVCTDSTDGGFKLTMDGLSNIATGLVSASVSDGLNVDVLRAVNNLSEAQSALLFSSIGIGRSIDVYA